MKATMISISLVLGPPEDFDTHLSDRERFSVMYGRVALATPTKTPTRLLSSSTRSDGRCWRKLIVLAPYRVGGFGKFSAPWQLLTTLSLAQGATTVAWA